MSNQDVRFISVCMCGDVNYAVESSSIPRFYCCVCPAACSFTYPVTRFRGLVSPLCIEERPGSQIPHPGIGAVLRRRGTRARRDVPGGSGSRYRGFELFPGRSLVYVLAAWWAQRKLEIGRHGFVQPVMIRWSCMVVGVRAQKIERSGCRTFLRSFEGR